MGFTHSYTVSYNDSWDALQYWMQSDHQHTERKTTKMREEEKINSKINSVIEELSEYLPTDSWCHGYTCKLSTGHRERNYEFGIVTETENDYYTSYIEVNQFANNNKFYVESLGHFQLSSDELDTLADGLEKFFSEMYSTDNITAEIDYNVIDSATRYTDHTGRGSSESIDSADSTDSIDSTDDSHGYEYVCTYPDCEATVTLDTRYDTIRHDCPSCEQTTQFKRQE